MTSVTPLAAFSYDWVGGDIRGLQGIAEKLYAYIPHVQDLAGQLSVVVRDLTDDGADGWQGKAASAFTAAWNKQATTAAALEDYVAAVGLAIDNLAVELSQLENALEQDAHEASGHDVQIAADGTVAEYTGAQGQKWAQWYQNARSSALNLATQARTAAAQQLNNLYQQVLNPNPHPNAADAVTGAGLLADMLATPTAARREVSEKIKDLKGEELNVKDELAKARQEGKPLQKLEDESSGVSKELDEVQEELGKTGKLESALSKLLDTRVRNVRGYLAGEAGPGKHVAGNTPEDLKAAAGDDPSALDKLLNFADDIPVVDIATTAVGIGVGTYEDVQGGQSLGSALGDETISNVAGTVAANVAVGYVGAEFGAELGAAAGPVGIAVGAIVGYGVGSLTHNLLVEPWGQDEEKYGAVLGIMYGIGHSEAATVDGARELAVGVGQAAAHTAVSVGHAAEHYWDDIF